MPKLWYFLAVFELLCLKLTSLATRFTTGTTGLKSQFFAPGLQWGKAFLGPSGQVNVNGSPHAGSQVGGAGVQVAQLFVQHEFLAGFGFDGVTNSLDTTSQPFENTSDITTWKLEEKSWNHNGFLLLCCLQLWFHEKSTKWIKNWKTAFRKAKKSYPLHSNNVNKL